MAAELPPTLITTYLQMTDASAFRPAFLPDDDSRMLMLMARPDVAYYRFLYGAVGGPWRWRDRLLLGDQALAALLAEPGASVHVLYERGVPAGFIELVARDTEVEIVYVGLRLEFVGRGLGKHLLSCGIAEAWRQGSRRVWLHTCNLDAPQALPNYLARGFEIYDVQEQPMPERYA
jgi:GNAT superfamily N-acetyltransferase